MIRRTELKKKILHHLLLHTKVTRPELVTLTGSRAASVFEAVDELKAERRIIEPERRTRRTGRRAPELEINPGYGNFVGVELRPAGCVGVLINAAGKILHRSNVKADRRDCLEAVKQEIFLLLQRLHETSGDDWKTVRGLGFADPGLVDRNRRFSVRAVNVPHWQELASGRYLEQISALPVAIWQETVVKTYLECLKSAAGLPETIFCLTVDGGIGGGWIRKSDFLSGIPAVAVELGHLTVTERNVRCRCGKCGCLEACAGSEALAAKVDAARAAGADLGAMPEKFSMKAFAAGVKENEILRGIAGELCRDLGMALSQVVTLLTPEKIVIAGEFALLGEFLTDAVRRELASRCLPEMVQHLEITLSVLENSDTARGAALMMRENILLGKDLPGIEKSVVL